MAADVLIAGGLVAIPTETVYGLAANAYDTEAVVRIFDMKQRPLFNPLIVHTSDINRLSDFAGPIPPVLQEIAKQCWPGPLTILLPRGERIDPLVTAGSALVAVRIPAHSLTRKLLERLPFPLAAPSANLFGTVSPTTAQHVAAQFGDRLGYILDGGPCAVGIESTIIKLGEKGLVEILRPGGIPIEKLVDILAYTPLQVTLANNAPEAPGMLKSHYAPRIPLLLGDLSQLLKTHGHRKIAVLSLQPVRGLSPHIPHIALSSRGDLHEAARNLFSALRHLENSEAEVILAEPMPETGLGIAMNDRLQRAAS